jgi:23S rRNA pseudouridine1911/1915/1917 synthase
MEILYSDDRVVVCVKPQGILSTDEPGGLPELIRKALGDEKAVVKTVHRLDRAVGGLMVLARTARAASDISKQIETGLFEKEYTAVAYGFPPAQGLLEDYLKRDPARKMTYVVPKEEKDARIARLSYQVLDTNSQFSKVWVRLETGRTHQIRVQFSSRGWPLVGDRKYADRQDECNIALWSTRLVFYHPRTGKKMEFRLEPPDQYPWNSF